MNDFTYHSSGLRLVDIGFSESNLKIITDDWKNFVKTIPPYPTSYEGKGIVVCAGGISFFTCFWVLINILRKELNCTLPVQMWYVGDEMTKETIDALKKLDVSCYNFLDYESDLNLKGWMLKPLAILLSSFKEVMYLDADNIPTVNPEFLFEFAGYKEYGTMFWPDFWRTGNENHIWKIVECEPDNMQEQESGQLLINKEKCWNELNLALFFNRNSDIYYELLLGDKDTFRFAWLALKSDFYFIKHGVGSCGYIDDNGVFFGNTMVQHSPEGEICFLHRNFLKWDRTKASFRAWTTIKRYNQYAQSKRYILFGSPYGHKAINLEGDLEILSFDFLLGDLETKCLNYLEELRASTFYKKFIVNRK